MRNSRQARKLNEDFKRSAPYGHFELEEAERHDQLVRGHCRIAPIELGRYVPNKLLWIFCGLFSDRFISYFHLHPGY